MASENTTVPRTPNEPNYVLNFLMEDFAEDGENDTAPVPLPVCQRKDKTKVSSQHVCQHSQPTQRNKNFTAPVKKIGSHINPAPLQSLRRNLPTQNNKVYKDSPTPLQVWQRKDKTKVPSQQVWQQSQPTQSNKGAKPLVKKSGGHTTPAPLQVSQRKDKTEEPSQLVCQQSRPTQSSKGSTPPVKKSGGYTTPTPLQVSQRKDKTKEPSQRIWSSKVSKPPVKKSGGHTTPAPLQVSQRKDKTKVPSHRVCQQSRPTQSSKGSTPPVKKSGRHTTPAPLQISQKTKVPSQQVCQKRDTESSKKVSNWDQELIDPVHHIEWDDDEPGEPIGQDCPICECDLAEDTEDNEESEFSILPVVDVLLCGHAFHSKCLQSLTSEEQSTDPPCYTCFSAFS